MIAVSTSGASGGLRRLASSLNAIASGASRDAALERARAELVATLGPIVASHIRSGRAASELEISIAGDSVSVKSAGYLKFHEWWPLRNGLPDDVKMRVLEIFREETTRLLAAR